MEQINSEKIVKYSGVKKSKIVMARVVDFCFLVVISLLMSLVVMSITALTPGFTNLLNKAEEIQLNSKLYSKDKNGKVFLTTEILDASKDMPTDEKNKRLDDSLTYFFSSDRFFKDNEGIKLYNDYKKDALKNDKHMFVLEGENYIENKESGVVPADYYSFYKNILEEKAYKYLVNDKTYHDISKKVTIIIISEQVGCPLISYLILYFLVPLLSFKNHNTLGFKTYKIGIVDGNGFVLKTGKALGALSFSCFVVGILSLATFFIPLIISMSFFFNRNDNKNLTGYIFNYYFVDVSNHKVYENIDDYDKEDTKVDKNPELFDNTPLEVKEDESK